MEINQHYTELLNSIKQNIQNAQIATIRKVNYELTQLYLTIGQLILEQQTTNSWGKSIVEQLAIDIKKSFPNSKGFSARNLWDMRRFYQRYQHNDILRQLVAEIPWGHNLLIMNKIKNDEIAKFYIESSSEYGWSRNVLLNQIKANAYHRSLTSEKQHNFKQTLPEHLAEQATEAIKSSYNLEFLGLKGAVREIELENKLMTHIRDLIIELGYGFAYLGNQYKITISQKDYFIDLLFYHRKLQCLVAIELKTGDFKPAYTGQLNFYLEVLDDTVKMKHENPSIGILLCASKDDIIVEYALRTTNKPIGVAEYQLIDDLPSELKGVLPTSNDLKKLF